MWSFITRNVNCAPGGLSPSLIISHVLLTSKAIRWITENTQTVTDETSYEMMTGRDNTVHLHATAFSSSCKYICSCLMASPSAVFGSVAGSVGFTSNLDRDIYHLSFHS